MADERIPFAKLGIPANMERQLGPSSRRKTRYALARGAVPLTVDVQLGVLYLLAGDEHPKISAAARKTLSGLPPKQILKGIGINSHPKVLEFIAEFHSPNAELDARVGMFRTANDRTVMLIAARANSTLCETLSRNHERLLITPGLYTVLYGNEACSDALLAATASFLRLHDQLPEVPEVRPFRAPAKKTRPARAAAAERPAARTPAARTPAAKKQAAVSGQQVAIDLEAEIEAALRGEQSPALIRAQGENLKMFDLGEPDEPDAAADEDEPEEDLGGFVFDFKDDAEGFGWDLTQDKDDADGEEEQRQSLEAKIREMSVGQRIKLAYLGNKEARGILVRDSNKIVSTAVVKSGRCTDQEVAGIAGNKNLAADVLRVVATNPEWTRKYPVKVALVQNPKCPIPTALSFVPMLQKKDLQALTRNRGVSSVVTQAAMRLFRQKYRK